MRKAGNDKANSGASHAIRLDPFGSANISAFFNPALIVNTTEKAVGRFDSVHFQESVIIWLHSLHAQQNDSKPEGNGCDAGE